MTKRNNFTVQSVQPASLGRYVVVGAAIALILITIFLGGVENPDPAWGTFWMVRPLIIVPLAGAAGGAFYYFTSHMLSWNKTGIAILGFVVYVFGLWIGTVLGLDGTLWN